MSRRQSRQQLALEFGATDIATERGDEGVSRIREILATTPDRRARIG